VNFRHQILKVNVCQGHTHFELEGDKDLEIVVNGTSITITPNNLVTV
jgi:maltose phosphorylase